MLFGQKCLVAQGAPCPKVSGQRGRSSALLTKPWALLLGYISPEKGIPFSNLHEGTPWNIVWSSIHAPALPAALTGQEFQGTSVSWRLRDSCITSAVTFPRLTFWKSSSSARHSLTISLMQTPHSLSVLIWKLRYFPLPRITWSSTDLITSLFCSQFIMANFYWVLLLARQCSKYITCITSFNPHNTLWYRNHYYQWWNAGTKKN